MSLEAIAVSAQAFLSRLRNNTQQQSINPSPPTSKYRDGEVSKVKKCIMCFRMSMDNVLDKLKALLADEANNVYIYVNSNESKFTSDIFNLSLNNTTINESKNPEISKLPGIYIFKMSENLECDKYFDSVKYGAKTNDNLENNTFKKGDVLYLGKTEVSLESRLNEHLLSCGNKTYSLRLFDDKRKYLFGNFVLFTFELKKEYDKYKKIILSTIESELHDLLNPVVGSRRT